MTDTTEIDKVNRAVAEFMDDVFKGGNDLVRCSVAPVTDEVTYWAYSPATRIEQAWELVDEMNQDQFVSINGNDKNSWTVSYVSRSSDAGQFLGDRILSTFDAPTAPLAICLAYLTWKGVEL